MQRWTPTLSARTVTTNARPALATGRRTRTTLVTTDAAQAA